MSASSMPTVAPSAASASARLTAVVRLADAALAGGDGDDVLHAGHQLDAALHGVGDDLGIDVDADVADARHGLQLAR